MLGPTGWMRGRAYSKKCRRKLRGGACLLAVLYVQGKAGENEMRGKGA